jgi:hypothetical protein
VLFYSCGKEEIFDETLLYGKWKPVSGTSMHFRYDRNGEGVTWNPNEDQLEYEGQKFTWELVKSELTQIHLMEIGGGKIPKVYTVTELTASSLKYKDSFSSYSFTRLQ